MRAHTDFIFFHLESGITKPFSYQCTVTFHTVRKSFPGTPQHLFRFCLHHTCGWITFARDFHRLVISIYEKHCIPCKHGIYGLVKILQFLYICDSKTVMPDKFLNILRRNLPEMIDHLSKSRIIQHHVGNRNFYIDHKAVHLMFISQPHGTDQNITAIFQPASQIFLILPQICRYFPGFFQLLQ